MMTIRSSLRRLVLVVSALALVTGAASAAAGAATGPNASGGSDAAKAAKINVTSSDLPSPAKWSSSSAPSSAVSLGKAAVSCMKKAGAKVSNDPFGTVGKAGGNASADVTSKLFGFKGSLTGLPSVNSEVVFVSTAKQAIADLSAFGGAKVQPCLKTLMAGVTGAQSGGKVKASVAVKPLPHLGAGKGGVHLRFTLTGGNIPGKLYEDLYYYVTSRAEVALTYVNLTQPFSSAWADGIAKHVMARATKIAR
ncbi:MAG TPA: hypothetical protein VMU75_12010 [Acidimicrobiales bacterium]|nr:hypothetical protein [Acidimicrobiales bacterium]